MSKHSSDKQALLSLVQKLRTNHDLTDEELFFLVESTDEDVLQHLCRSAAATACQVYGNSIYIRGLIEYTNYCPNDCYYCGLRRDNANVHRYRLTKEQILQCCRQGYQLGFRTFVLQGGEDPFFDDDTMEDIVFSIRKMFPDCAITLSLGEKTKDAYQRLYAAGANRYLLRHETATESHYNQLHPKEMSFSKRMQCLRDLKEIGYQVGCGFMVGSPYQTTEHIVRDLRFIKEFQPHMVGLGPYIPQQDTPFAKETAGTLKATIKALAVVRLLHPMVLLPATTALSTIDTSGREKGILAGANVVMPNLSPTENRKDYQLYDNKLYTGEEAAQGLYQLKSQMEAIGYQVVTRRGDYKSLEEN